MNVEKLTTPMHRTFLYVPGDRGDRLRKATGRGADAVVADLEDAVVPAAKDQALSIVQAWLRGLAPETAESAWVRLNSGERGIREAKVLGAESALAGVFIPKVERPEEVDQVRIAAGRTDLQLAPMIESAAGLVNAVAIATTHGVTQLHMGELDLAADLGLTPGDDERELDWARSQVVVASRYAGLLPPAAPVSARLNDEHWFRASTEALARMGFVGRDCIHPSQVQVAREVFSPDPEQIAWAFRVLERAKTEPGSFRDEDGTMIDEAVLRRARQLSALA